MEHVVRSITLPLPLYQRWKAYQAACEIKPPLSTTLAQLLDEHVRAKERTNAKATHP